ncbi:Retinoblastoma-associated protein [Porites harrisoni]
MDIKQSFDAFIQQVGLEEESAKKSWELWESFSSKAAEFPKDALIPWFVCATYVTICRRRYTAPQARERFTICSLSKILKAAKMRMVEFFQKMKEFAEICNVENSVTESLNELKKTFCISSAIFFKFKRVVPVVLEDDQSFSKSESSKDAFFKTCWLLFLVCKGWQMHQVGDLMTAFYLLLCCVDYVHRRLLPSSQHPTDLQETNISLEEGILPYLFEESSVPYTSVNSVHAQYFQPFLDSEGWKRDLLNVDDLNTMYNEIYDKCGDVDERDFFDASGHLWIPFSKEESIATCDLNGGSSSAFVHEPHVMTTTEVLEASDTPGQELLRFWNCCKRDPKTLIQSCLTDVRENFMKGFTEAVNEENSNNSNQIFIQAKKLYYRVMEAMLLAEEKRLSCSDFSALLNSASFHISLMACSLEVLMADKGLPSAAIKFPWILHVLELKAFDFFKVTESFILHEPHLGSKLIKHLNSIEEQVLESLAWKKWIL